MQYIGMYELQYHRRPVNLDLTLSIAHAAYEVSERMLMKVTRTDLGQEAIKSSLDLDH